MENYTNISPNLIEGSSKTKIATNFRLGSATVPKIVQRKYNGNTTLLEYDKLGITLGLNKRVALQFLILGYYSNDSCMARTSRLQGK